MALAELVIDFSLQLRLGNVMGDGAEEGGQRYYRPMLAGFESRIIEEDGIVGCVGLIVSGANICT